MSDDKEPPLPIETVFGRRVQAIRQQRGMKQHALAERLGIDQPAMSRLEQGRRAVRLGEAVEIANLLGVSLETLTFYDGNRDHLLHLVTDATRSSAQLRDAALQLVNAYAALISYLDSTPELFDGNASDADAYVDSVLDTTAKIIGYLPSAAKPLPDERASQLLSICNLALARAMGRQPRGSSNRAGQK